MMSRGTERAIVLAGLLVAAGVLSTVASRTKPGTYDGRKVGPVIQTSVLQAGSDDAIVLPPDCISFSVNDRGASIPIQFGYYAGAIAAGDYVTIPAGQRYVESDIDPDGSAATTIYLRAASGTPTAEIITWTGK